MRNLFPNQPASIEKTLRTITIIMTVVVLSVLLVSMVYYNSVVLQYQALTENVNRAMSLSTSIKRDIDTAAYNLVAGRTTPADSMHLQLFVDTRVALRRLGTNSSFEQNTYLLQVAQRTLGTIEGYFNQLIENIETQAPVHDNEIVLDDIQQVTELLDEVLIEFTAYEVRLAALRDANLQNVNAAMNLVQILVCAVAIVFVLYDNRLLQRRITQPVDRMQDMAGRIAAGDFDARVEPPEVAELDDLTKSMNQMAVRIQSLMDANTEKQRLLRIAQVQILQAQISPHFLYNTLDTIVALAEADRLEDVATTTIALSNFHRISLSKGNDWIPVSQEAAQIESYLTIQKMRYGAMLDYTVDIDEEMFGEYMLKILLQPLVENAIYHGVKLSRKGGGVYVSGRRDGDRLRFEVRNTGPGMSAERVEELRSSLGQERPQGPAQPVPKGYGLSNVYQRIRLFYDVEDGLTIESDPEEGTTVTLRLPVSGGGEKQDV